MKGLHMPKKTDSGDFSMSFKDEADLLERVKSGVKQFKDLYKKSASLIVRAPGRAEVIGNHTDYNYGFALSCGISRSTLAFIAKRNDSKINIYSNSFPSEILTISLSDLQKDLKNKWLNYPIAVVSKLREKGYPLSGADILIDTNVPLSGGVSSSASFELAVAKSLCEISKINISATELSALCKEAENSPFVDSPCGFLDQGSVAFAKRDNFVFFDFQPKDDSPVSEISLVKGEVAKENLSFVIIVDNQVKRILGETGYPARKKSCYNSLPFWTKKLKREVASLREISVAEFEKFAGDLEDIDLVMRMRVEHIVYENERVIKATKALKEGNFRIFADMLTQSGKSALELYGLDEKTPELTLLVEEGRRLEEVWGIRNMGGGFSAIALALIKQSDFENFSKKLDEKYFQKYERHLEFIPFSTTNGVEVLLS